ncbi:PucR family transcriptional regulator ligand-binding domain-containing protein [Mycolicibacterium sp. lyk4-40-TYG-92]|uniref:PucR family transcriptional regulator n=1 Tax=Mycolicibacterium sp. lyk4-40-TYG-92 TaxID=3040295 RepID=UPI00254F273F|nr:PucR family transcriptional regulator ligand-binding domain-containing protein [Mycolicibacterium sp. lyk4-40-TYG-92]
MPTVAEIVALPVIQQGEPEILCATGFDRPIRWVHVSDVPDLSEVLQGGELVLTTGAALRAAPLDYLRSVAAAHAVGVVVELGAGAVPLPVNVGAIAEELGLALVAVRRVIKFVEVTEQVHRVIVADQYQEVDFARQTHEVFTDLSMRRATPTGIAEAAANLLGAPVVLEDLTHQAIAVATAGRPTPDVLRDWQRRSRQHETGAERTDGWVISEVGRGEDAWGRLIALSPAEDVAARFTMVLERASQALVLHRMAERGRTDIEHQAQAGLLEDVARERIRFEDEATARAFALGLRPAAQYQPATLRIAGWAADTDPVSEQRRGARLLDVVTRSVKALGHSGLFSLRGPGEIAMVLSLNTRAGGTLEPLGRALRRDAERAVDAHGLVLGVGTPAPGLIDAIHRITDAAHVADAALSLPASQRVCFRVADIRLRGLLSMLRTDPRVQRFAEGELRALILHDMESGGERLLDVLRGYLELGGNKSALASRLHLSRPSLYAKLNRIEQILGVDLADGESVTSLHVALLILETRNAFGGAGAPL